MKAPGHLQIGEIRLPPGGEWMDPAAAWRFVHVRGGAAYWLDGNQSRSLAAGEMLVVAPAVRGFVRASQIGEVILHSFRFEPDLLWGFFTLEERRGFEPGDANALQTVQFLPSSHPVTQQFAVLIASGCEHRSLLQRVEVLGMVMAVFERNIHPAHVLQPVLRSSHRFEQIIARMPDIEIINYTPVQLARLCGCSSRHFNRLFRQHFRKSARAWQAELRALRARQLRREEDQPPSRVATGVAVTGGGQNP